MGILKGIIDRFRAMGKTETIPLWRESFMFSQRKKCRNRKKRSDKTLFSQVMGQLSGERSPGIYGHFRTCCCLKVCYFYDIIRK